MVADIGHLAASPSLTLSEVPEGQLYQCRRRIKRATQFCDARRNVIPHGGFTLHRDQFIPADANFEGRAALGRLPPDVPCVSVHWASFAPRYPPRTPTAKDFAMEGRPVGIAQPPWLGAPDRSEQRRDTFDVLALDKRNQVC
jgi:hypothetical protein